MNGPAAIRRSWLLVAVLAGVTGSAGLLQAPWAESALPPGSECTVAVLSGRVTADGRPLLWKNRDTVPASHALAANPGAGLEYTGVIYSDQPSELWSGINVAGFGIMNSLPANDVDSLGTGLGNGQLMALALARCVTLADFEALLDSTDTPGRRSLSNFGVIDGHGGAAFYECTNHTWLKYDVAASPRGWAVRTNYTYSGGPVLPAYGTWRHERATARLELGLDRSPLSWHDLLDDVATDLLPEPGLENGTRIAYDETVCRSYTRSAQVIRGMAGTQDIPVLFTRLGFPALSLPMPWSPVLGPPPVELAAIGGGCWFSGIVQARTQAATRLISGRHYLEASALQGDWRQRFADSLWTSWRVESGEGGFLPDSLWFVDWITRGRRTLLAQAWTPDTLPVPLPLPSGLAITGHWPNPFNATFTLGWRQDRAGTAIVRLYDLRGRRVQTVTLPDQAAGEHSLRLDGLESAASGLYLLELEQGDRRDLRKVTLLK